MPDKKVRAETVGIGDLTSRIVMGSCIDQSVNGLGFPGVMQVKLGSYHSRDIEFFAVVAADAATRPNMDGPGKYRRDIMLNSARQQVHVAVKRTYGHQGDSRIT